MNGSPSAIISLGPGSWGSPGLMVTLGLGVAVVVVSVNPAAVRLQNAFGSPARISDAHGSAARIG